MGVLAPIEMTPNEEREEQMSNKNNGIAKAQRDGRHEEAEGRNAAWRAMSPKHQLADLDARGLTATKQRARIAKLMEKGGR